MVRQLDDLAKTVYVDPLEPTLQFGLMYQRAGWYRCKSSCRGFLVYHLWFLTFHTVCDVKWLGLRSEDILLIPPESQLDLKGRDKTIAKSLLASKMLQVKYATSCQKIVSSIHVELQF